MGAHSILSPSSMHRWSNCPGSAQICAAQPQRTSDAAEEGSAAHALAALFLTAENGLPEITPNSGHIMVRDADGEYSLSIGVAKGWRVTAEMLEAVSVYVEFVRSLPGKIYVEQKLDVILDPAMFGTADAVVVDKASGTLHLVDFKYGINNSVDADMNPQLLAYASGALQNVKGKIQTIKTSIVQPRDRHNEVAIRTYECSRAFLEDWQRRVLIPAALAATSENPPVSSGPWCQWCSGAAVCGCVRDVALEAAQTDFASLTPVDPYALSNEDLAKAMKASQIIRDWASAVEDLALERMTKGEVVPGFKLVQKRANRKWRDEEVVHNVLIPLLGEDIYERKLKTPPNIEKLAKSRKQKMDDVLNKLWMIPDNGVTIAPEHDKRQAVTTLDVEFVSAPDLSFLE